MRPRRLAASIWLPWFVGVVILLLLAAAVAILVGRDRGVEGVTEAALLEQQRVSTAGSQFLRRSVNEGVEDLVAASVTLAAAPSAPPGATLAEMLLAQERWTALAVVPASGGPPLASVGEAMPADLLGGPPPEGTGVTVLESGGAPRIVSFAPLVRPGQPDAVILGVSDRRVLDAILAVGAPGAAYASDDVGRVLASYGAPPAADRLPAGPLLDAALLGATGREGTSVSEATDRIARVLAWSPVSGPGPAGAMPWAVVVDRTVTDLAPPDPRYRLPGIVFGLVLAVVSLAVFGWIRSRVLMPVERLEDEAERVAYGDLHSPVPVGRYDDVGQVARALERLRLQLIARRSRPGRPQTPGDPEGEPEDGPPPGPREGGP